MATTFVSVIIIFILAHPSQFLVYLDLHFHIVLVLTFSVLTARLVMQELLFSHQINLANLVHFIQTWCDGFVDSKLGEVASVLSPLISFSRKLS